MEKGSKASARASEKAKKYAGNVRTAKPKQEGYASSDDFWNSYQQAFIDTSKGKMEIQSIDPGEFLLFNDTPFVRLLSAKGAKEGDSITEYFDAFSDAEKEELGIYNIKKVVCHGVVTPHFVNKRPFECDRETEISADLIPASDLMTIYNAIKKLSVPEEVTEKADEFRGESEDSQSGTAKDSPDSESVSQTAIADTIPEDSQ